MRHRGKGKGLLMPSRTRSHDPLVGLALSHYRVTARLGGGGMGVVYKAEDTELGRPVALKFLHTHLAQDPQALERFRREARAASALNHPNICIVHEIGKHEGASYIVMEYLDGESLKQRICRGKVSLDLALHVGIQIADALDAAHTKGIIHRDIKPANIFITVRGDTKLLDFGLAKLVHKLSSLSASQDSGADDTIPLSTASGLLVGTIEYMAPEQLQGEHLDSRTDLFALGLVLFEMLTGSNPFIGSSPTSTIANILKEDPRPTAKNPEIPADIEMIVLRCLSKKPSDRFPSARALLDDLLRVRGRLQLHLPVDSAQVASSAVSTLAISRPSARVLFMTIQVGYLVMYALSLHFFHDVVRVSRELYSTHTLAYLLLGAATLGIPLRIYLFTALSFDFADIGRQFRTLFPFVLLLDLIWAATPLLFLGQLQGLVLLCAGALAFLPLSQRTLLYEAYARHGGRSSGLRVPPPSLS